MTVCATHVRLHASAQTRKLVACFPNLLPNQPSTLQNSVKTTTQCDRMIDQCFVGNLRMNNANFCMLLLKSATSWFVKFMMHPEMSGLTSSIFGMSNSFFLPKTPVHLLAQYT
jgi:hypothetical protein